MFGSVLIFIKLSKCLALKQNVTRKLLRNSNVMPFENYLENIKFIISDFL